VKDHTGKDWRPGPNIWIRGIKSNKDKMLCEIGEGYYEWDDDMENINKGDKTYECLICNKRLKICLRPKHLLSNDHVYNRIKTPADEDWNKQCDKPKIHEKNFFGGYGVVPPWSTRT
jgi:hypothetical protein